jgi:hypothetical protein
MVRVVVPVVAVELAERETVVVQFVLQGLLAKIAVTPVGNPDAIEKVRDMFVKEIAVIDDDKLPPPWTSVTLLRVGGCRAKLKAPEGYTVSKRFFV